MKTWSVDFLPCHPCESMDSADTYLLDHVIAPLSICVCLSFLELFHTSGFKKVTYMHGVEEWYPQFVRPLVRERNHRVSRLYK